MANEMFISAASIIPSFLSLLVLLFLMLKFYFRKLEGKNTGAFFLYSKEFHVYIIINSVITKNVFPLFACCCACHHFKIQPTCLALPSCLPCHVMPQSQQHCIAKKPCHAIKWMTGQTFRELSLVRFISLCFFFALALGQEHLCECVCVCIVS